MAGDSGVGKTNVLLRYVKNTFQKSKPTIGVEFAYKMISATDGKKIKAQIWDTCKIIKLDMKDIDL